MQTAYRVKPAETMMQCIVMIKDAVTYLEMKRTITADKDFIEAVEHLRDEFPTMKLEEWRIVFNRLKQGKYKVSYERLKLPELVEVFKQYLGERAEMMEHKVAEQKKRVWQEVDDRVFETIKQAVNDACREKEEQETIKRVPTDDKGRWEHIHYNGKDESNTGEEAG